MTVSTFPMVFEWQFLDNNGLPVANGSIATYYAGTLNVAPTYADSLGVAANPNPVQLDASGRASLYGNSSISYFVELHDANNNLIWQEDNVNFGTGVLNGAVLINGEQTVIGNKIFSGVTGFGPGANTEYDNGILNAVFGARTANVGGFEIIGSQSANIEFTKQEGVRNGALEYNLATDTFNLVVAGTPVMTVGNTTVSFPDATNFTVNGAALLTNTSIISIGQGGTGQNTAANALLALVPAVAGNTGNTLVVVAGHPQWSAITAGKTIFLNSPYTLFNGSSQASWTNFNVTAAGVPNTASSILLEGYGNILGAGAGGSFTNYCCIRANTSLGLTSGHPETDTPILVVVDVQNASHVQGSGGVNQGEFPLYANGSFDFIAPITVTGIAWNVLQIRVIGYKT